VKIEKYHFGRVVIEGRTYTSDVIVYADRVTSNWWRREGHELSVEDLTDVFREKPDVLVVGTGSPGLMRILPETRLRLEEEKIELIAKPTEEACALFNVLQTKREAVACLHLTC
jgi:hypothetical protein